MIARYKDRWLFIPRILSFLFCFVLLYFYYNVFLVPLPSCGLFANSKEKYCLLLLVLGIAPQLIYNLL